MKNVFDYVVVFVAGVTVGAVTTSIIFKQKQEKEVDDKVNEIINELQRANAELKDADIPFKEENGKEFVRYNEMFNADAVKPADKPTIFEENSVEAGMRFVANYDDPEDDDEEDENEDEENFKIIMQDWVENHSERFELIRKQDYELHVEPIEYNHIELVQLSNTDIITEDGDEVPDIEQARKLLDKVGFSSSVDDSEDVYLRDNELYYDYVIHNAPDMTREEYLGL